MTEYLDYLWLLALIPAYYLVEPLLIWARHSYPAHPKPREVDLSKIKPSFAAFLKTHAQKLSALGFEELTLARLSDAAPGIISYLAMLVNRATGDKAMVVVLVVRGVPLETLYVEFSTRFDSGEMFDTFNSPELGAYRPAPRTIRTQVPEVKDPGELYELHKFVMARHPVKGQPVVYPPGQALEYLTRHLFVESNEEQVKRGWLYYDEPNDVYRPTLRGAYLIGWGVMQPFQALRMKTMRKRARAILEEFDARRPA